jgi:tryptophan-rich sensory protein
MYALIERLNSADEAKLAEWDRLWQTAAPFRKAFLTLTAVWGLGLLVLAVVRIPLIYSVSIDAMTVVSPVLQWGTFAALIGWSLLYRKQRERRAAAHVG